MTKKEIDIQRALGTLPLWKRMELGEIEFISIPVKTLDKSTSLKVMCCKNAEEFVPNYYYDEDRPGARERVIRRIMNDCKAGGW